MNKRIFQRITGFIAVITILSCIASLFPMGNAFGVGAPPSIAPIADQTILEDAATGAISFAVSDPESDPLTVTANSSNTDLVPDANITLVDLGAGDWTVQVTPAANENSTTTITITVDDGTSTTEGSFLLTVTPVNDPPSFTMGPNVTALEDVAYSAIWATDILAGPTNESSQSLTFSVTNNNNSLFSTQPSIAADGTLSFAPATNLSGSAIVTVVSLVDNGGTANGGDDTYVPASNTFTITIQAVNDPPTAQNDSYAAGLEDGGGISRNPAQGVLNNDTDVETPVKITAELYANATKGTLILNQNGSFDYVPDANMCGDDTFTYRALDDGGVYSNIATVTLTITCVNDMPDFTASNPPAVDEDSGAQSILNWATFDAGPADEDASQAVSAYHISNSTCSTLLSAGPSVDTSGTLTYTPALNQNGSCTFDIRVQDTGGTANGGVDTGPIHNYIITINAVNDLPTISSIADQFTQENTAITGIAFTIGDVETPAASLVVTASSSNQTLVPDANINSGGTGASRTIDITPAANQSGTATITVTVTDADSGTANTTFTLTVNARPTISDITDQTIDEDGTTGAVLFTIGDAETAATSLVITKTSSNTTLVPNNDTNIALNCIGVDCTVQVTPAADQYGSTTITIEVQDPDGGTTSDTFLVTVNAVNDEPSFTMGPNVTVDEDSGPYSSIWATNILAGPANESGQTLTFDINNNNNSLFSVQPAIAPNGTLTFTPASNAYGIATVTVNSLKDDGGTANGGDDTYVPASNTFTITVNSVNDLPTITNISDRLIQENTAISGIAFTIGDVETAAALLVVTASSSNQTLVPDANISSGGTGVSRTIDITPAANQSGTTTITVTVTDADSGAASTTFTLTVNARPTISDIANQTIDEDNPTPVIPFTIGDAETAATSLVITKTSSNTTLVPIANIILGGSGSNRTVQVTPATDQYGSTTITIEVQDPDGGTTSDTFLLTVNPVNDEPSFTMGSNVTVNEDSGPYSSIWATNILAGPANESWQTLTFDINNNNNSLFSVQPAIAPNGTLTFTPIPDGNGIATVTVNSLKDNGGTANGGDDTYIPASNTFTITVNSVNDAPSFTAKSIDVVGEDWGPVIVNGWVTSFDAGPADEDAWQTVNNYIVSNSTCNTLLSAGPTVDTSGKLTYTPAFNQNGSCTFDVRVQDTGGTANGGVDVSPNQSFTIGVWEVNDPPIAVDDALGNGVEDVVYRIPFSTLTANDNRGADNEASQSLEVASVSSPVNGTVSIDAQEVVFTPSPNYNGSASFQYKVRDNGTTHGAPDSKISSNSAFAYFTITPVNDPPSFSASNPPAVLEDSGEQVIPAWASFDPGPNNESFQQVLRYDIVSTTCASLLSAGPIISNDGTLRFEPLPDAYGTCVFTARVLDNGGSTAPDNNVSPTKSFIITVTAVNDEPVFTDAGDVTVDEDYGCYTQTLWATSIAAGPANESLQALTWNITVSNPSLFSAKPALNQNGTLTFCTAPNKNGSATVRVSLQDDGGTANGGVNTSSIHIFTITITAVNDPPVAVDDNYSTAVNEPVSDNVLNNDYDIDNLVTDFFVSQVANPAHGVLTLQPNGSFTYTPNLNFAGKDTFTYFISDGSAQSRVATVTITVIPQPDEYLRPWDVEKEYRWVKVRSGIATDLDCSTTEKGVIITLRSTGDGVVLTCMPDNVARLYVVEEDDLPEVPLPNRYKYVAGFTFEINEENELLDVLPSWARLSFVIRDESLSYTILYWDPEEESWFEIPSAIEVNGQGEPFEYDEERMVIIGVRTFKVYKRIEAVINFTGTFILVEK